MPLTVYERSVLSNLEGLISDEVGCTLAAHAEVVPANYAIVEIGSYKGKSTAYLAMGARAGHRSLVYAVDPWDTPGNAGGRFGFNQPSVREAFLTQLETAGVSQYVISMQDFSVNAARKWAGAHQRIGLLYIDGSHIAKDVVADFMAWRPYLAVNATVIFDDYKTARNPGVAVVVDNLRRTFGGSWEFAPAPLAIGRAKWT